MTISDEKKKRLDEITELMDMVVNDASIPKNIRKAVSDAKEKLGGEEELTVRLSGAIYALDAVSEDVNMPMHARTQIWTILGAIETMQAD
jgi:hypothetical protein